MTAANKLSASLEDYLEAIFHVVSEKQAAKPSDVSKRLGVNHSSVTEAVQVLADRGLVNHQPYGLITVTPEGKVIAENVVHRHSVLREFFVNILAVPHKQADEVACKMEHMITPEIMERFVHLLQFVETCPRGGAERIGEFDDYYQGAIVQEAEK